MKEYDAILDKFKLRLHEKHLRYGTSYKQAGAYFMFLRLRGELEELEQALLRGTGDIQTEALDVAICGILIADIIRELGE
jgi:NTP pyrophosphatase (non-canonical NTP hydrolase)